MYRIQAFNFVKNYFTVKTCATMEERSSIIKALVDSGEYTQAGISFEWLARS